MHNAVSKPTHAAPVAVRKVVFKFLLMAVCRLTVDLTFLFGRKLPPCIFHASNLK